MERRQGSRHGFGGTAQGRHDDARREPRRDNEEKGLGGETAAHAGPGAPSSQRARSLAAAPINPPAAKPIA